MKTKYLTMRIYLSIVLAIAILLNIVLFSCKKKEIDSETQSIVDHSLCEQEFMKIQLVVNNKALATGGSVYNPNPSPNACPKDTLVGDTTGFATGVYTNLNNLPGLILDWKNGCVDEADQVTRSGKLISKFTKPYGQSGSVITITPVNYKVGEVVYSGTIKTTRINATTYTTEVLDGHLSNGTWSIEWNSNRKITWIAGANDNDESNDVVKIEGSSNGVNREGRAFTVNITVPLIKSADCKWIKQGVLEITPAGFKTRTVDFGDGTCDNSGTFSVNGNSYAFNMQ